MVKLSAEQVCESKKKHNLLAIQYLIENTNKGLAQDYYLCNLCGNYHFYSLNKKIIARRETKLFFKEDKETHRAKMHKKQRKRFKR